MKDLLAPEDAISRIGNLLRIFRNTVPPENPTSRLTKLISIVDKLAQPKNVNPPKHLQDYIELWHELGKTRPSELPAKAIRYLSWETDIAISSEFQAVALRPERVNARSLQGFVRSVHRRWNSVKETASHRNVIAAIENYAGKNTLIDKWKQGLACVLHQDAPQNLARDIMTESVTWEDKAKEWDIEQNTEFGNETLKQCLIFVISKTLKSLNPESLYNSIVRNILPSLCWSPDSFKAAVEQTILASPHLSQQHSERVKDFALSDTRLLDPRHPTNANNWIGIGINARNSFVQWLSTEDIRLFFDHVLPMQSDPHGRKPFWLKYIGKVKSSRPLLSDDDENLWRTNSATMDKKNFGRTSHSSSAFLLDFGSILVVEFSREGNAAYIYENRNIPELADNFWSSEIFSMYKLKQQRKCVNRISHRGNWQWRMKTLLAQYGIHPGG